LQTANKIVEWWLYTNSWSHRTPVWDLISTCTINGKKGIVLVEAKAHWDELNDKPKKKSSDSGSKDDSIKNYERIGEAIEEANTAIKNKHPQINISRDDCYQLSNRVAHAWWLANQGIPVVLLYLGFLNCQDMNDGKRKLLKDHNDWQTCFNEHAKKVGVDTITNKWVDCGASEFITVCRSI